MLSLSAVLASLPPLSLLESDLARFCAQVVSRRSRAELEGLVSLFAEEELRGYPPSLGALLAAFCETLIAQQVEPQTLDARAVDVVLGSLRFLEKFGRRVEVRRQRLRPGTFISGELRQTLGMRLLIAPGRGRELMLVGPVDLAQVSDARFVMPLGVVVARLGTPDEAETLRMAWAAIEEAVGIDGPEAKLWEARFCQVARRENHDAETARVGLLSLSPELRKRLWDALMQHLRDQELAEQHRPQRRGLERRLAALGIASDLPWVDPLIGLAEAAYRATGFDPEVMAGRCPCPQEDLERWSQWVEVPAAQRQRIKELHPALIESHLVALAEEEAGRAEGLVPEELQRALTNLRDGCLRPRWQKSGVALSGVDPLALAEGCIAAGDDLQAMRTRLDALVEEARAQMVARPPRAPAEQARARKVKRTQEPGLEPEVMAAPHGLAMVAYELVKEGANGSNAPSLAQATLDEPPADASRGAVSGATGDPKESSSNELRPDRTIEARTTGRSPTGIVGPARFNLPPMPSVPPPRPSPRVRPRTDFPALPQVAPRPAPTRSERVERPPAEVSARVQPRALTLPRTAPPTARPPSQVLPRPPSSRTATVPHLVTPAQGHDFYDVSFRELELLERDLLQRGSVPGAADRLDAIGREANELHAALGPSARSGDKDFLAAQRRIEKVLEYLERIRPLLAGGALAGPSPEPSKGILGRLFGRRK